MVGVAMIGDRRSVTTTGMRRIGTRTVGSEHILRKNGTSALCPLCARMHRYIPNIHELTLKSELDCLCELNVPKRVNRSQWGAPTFIVPKKDGAVRFISEN
jgi:hypothetical protein